MLPDAQTQADLATVRQCLNVLQRQSGEGTLTKEASVETVYSIFIINIH